MVAYWDSTPESDPFYRAVKFSARLSAIAATFAGISAILLAVKLFFFSELVSRGAFRAKGSDVPGKNEPVLCGTTKFADCCPKRCPVSEI